MSKAKAKENENDKFDAWCKELDEVAVTHGYTLNGKSYVESTGREAWDEYFKDGYTPQAAFEEDVLNG